MIERKLDLDAYKVATVEGLALGIAVAESAVGRDPIVDLITFVALANVLQIPAMPVIMAIESRIKSAISKLRG